MARFIEVTVVADNHYPERTGTRYINVEYISQIIRLDRGCQISVFGSGNFTVEESAIVLFSRINSRD
jgi:hypothetical protein